MASAGQAQAHSSQPTHFSSPSGCRLSTCRPWYRGLVTFGSNGYCSVVTLRNICAKVTPKPWPGAGSRLLRTAGRLSGPPARSTSPPERRTGVLSDIAVLLVGRGLVDHGGRAASSGADHGAVGPDRLAAAQPRRRRHLQVHRRDREAALGAERRTG